MAAGPKIDVPGTSGFVRLQDSLLWAWKCEACSTADYPFDNRDDATEALKDHDEVCFET